MKLAVNLLFLLLLFQFGFSKRCFQFVDLDCFLLNFLRILEKLLLEAINPIFVVSQREQVLSLEVFELLLEVYHQLLLHAAFCRLVVMGPL